MSSRSTRRIFPGYLIGLMLLAGCAEKEEAEAVSPQPAPARPDSTIDSGLPALLDSLNGELVAVTVVDTAELRYRLLKRERFYLLQGRSGEERIFRHLRIDSARDLERFIARLQEDKGRPADVSVAALPEDLGLLPIPRKKEAFFAALRPMVVFHNEVIAAQRRRLEGLRGRRSLSSRDRLFVEEMARYYRLDECGQPLGGLQDSLRVLLERVDRIPLALALAQAAIESGWGASRFSRHGNNLFGQRVWEEEVEGLEPHGVEESRFKLAVFPTIGASIRSYMRNLNTHPAYEAFRQRRSEQRRGGESFDARVLAEGLNRYSTRGEEYVADVIGFIEYNRLSRFEETPMEGEGEEVP